MNLALYAFFEQVMFVFDNVLEKDVISYEYELYNSDQITGSFPNYSLIADPTIYLSGQSGSNVFSIAVENSTDVANIRYYGRVRTKDTSNNYSSWSPLVRTDQDSPLIGDQYLSSITAAKITAGTIGAHEVILSQAGPQSNFAAPANMAVLRSSDYDGTYDANTTTWTTGTDGWIIAGDGYAEFSSASIRGGLKAESVYINADNRWRRNDTDTAVSDQFKVGSSTKYLYFDGTNLTFTGAINATTFTGGSINIGDGTFQVNSLGAVTASSANITGTINATAGSIGGFEISGDDLTTGGNYFGSMRIGPSIPVGDYTAPSIEMNGGYGDAAHSGGYSFWYHPTALVSALIGIEEFPQGNYYPIINLDGNSGVTYISDMSISTTFGIFDEITSFSGLEIIEFEAKNRGIQYQASWLPGTNFHMAFGWNNGGGNMTGVVNNDPNVRFEIAPDYAYSDRRLKENIKEISKETLEKLYSTKVYEFNYKEEVPYPWLKGRNSIGVIADEIEDKMPQYTKKYEDNSYVQVSYTEMLPLILASIIDLNLRLKTLE